MLIRVIVFLLGVSPALRRVLWRWWYGRLARRFQTGAWTFMNYGLVLPAETAPTLDPKDEPDRLCIQLYERVVSDADLRGARVLEVGSGRGGGASYLARYRGAGQVTGADFSAPAVAWCGRQHGAVANLTFVVGDAEKLPFADATFDAVVNVESSHCYGNIDAFFREAARVLRPGGHFLYTDFRPQAEMAALDSKLAAMPGWRLVAREDITAGVVAALAADDARKRRLIDENIAPRLREIFGEFAGLAGGEMFEGFRKRELLYCRFAYQRAA